jgi:hypothetical protein
LLLLLATDSGLVMTAWAGVDPVKELKYACSCGAGGKCLIWFFESVTVNFMKQGENQTLTSQAAAAAHY